MSKEKEYENFGGWLLVLFLGQLAGIVINIAAALNQWGEFGKLNAIAQEILRPIMTTYTIQVVILVACSIFFMMSIRKRSPEGLKRTKIALVALSVVNVVFSVIIVSMTNSIIGGAANSSESVSTIISSIAIIALWFTYFTRSKRVAVYYFPENNSENIIDVDVNI